MRAGGVTRAGDMLPGGPVQETMTAMCEGVNDMSLRLLLVGLYGLYLGFCVWTQLWR